MLCGNYVPYFDAPCGLTAMPRSIHPADLHLDFSPPRSKSLPPSKEFRYRYGPSLPRVRTAV